MNEQQQENRLAREGAETCLGVLGDTAARTDCARVVVGYGRDGDDWGHAGHYFVHVRCDELAEDADENEQMANHPASRAEAIVGARMQEREDEGEIDWFQIQDISAA